jgi:serine/threonine protein kinase
VTMEAATRVGTILGTAGHMAPEQAKGKAVDKRADIWALPIGGERKPILVLQTPFGEYPAEFSPYGRWVSCQSNESGRWEVYVRAFPVSSGHCQVSNQGGARPQWRADGKELFFLGLRRDKVMAAGVRVVGESFQSDEPRELFAISPVVIPSAYWSRYDITADGQRFLVSQPSTAPRGPRPLTVVTNLQARLKK